MPTFLFAVDDVLDISGRYVMPVPGVPVSIPGVRKGLPIELRRPDGTVLLTEVASIPLLDPYDPKRPIQICIAGISKSDVPVGTEIWMRDDASMT